MASNLSPRARNIISIVSLVAILGVVYLLSRSPQPAPTVPLGQTVAIPQKEMVREYTAAELSKLFEANTRSKDSIIGKTVVVTGLRTASGASREIRDNKALVMLDGSKDGVTANNLLCIFTPTVGGRFSLSFLQWLSDAPDGTQITIKGVIAELPANEWKVDFFLKNCTIKD